MHFIILFTLIQLLLQSCTYLLFVVSFYLLSGKLYVIFAYVEPLISPRSPECYLWLVNLQVSKLLIPREYTLPWLSEVFCLKHLGASSYPRWISRISHHLSALSSANNACFNFLPRFLYFSFSIPLTKIKGTRAGSKKVKENKMYKKVKINYLFLM